MKFMRNIVFFLVLASSIGLGQPDYAWRIQRKIESDARYSVVVYADGISASLLQVEPIRAKIGATDRAAFEIVWMVLQDVRLPLVVNKTWTESRSANIFDRATGRDTTITSVVVSYADFERLAAESPDAYARIVRYLGSLNAEERRFQKMENLFHDPHIAAPLFSGATDFWNYAKVHSSQLTPEMEPERSLPPTFAMADQFEVPDSLLPEGSILPMLTSSRVKRPAVALDLSPSLLAVSHSMLTSENALGLLSVGAEFGFADRVLNLHPFQSPVWTWGGTLMFNLTGEKRDIVDHDFFWVRALGKTKFDSRKMFDFMTKTKLQLLFAPLTSYDQPPLNVTPGATLEMGTSKLWSFPFYVSVYFSSGSKDYSDPISTFLVEGSTRAYWSTIQWDAMMTFFWNVDSDPDYFTRAGLGRRLNQFRLDLGAGSYDVKAVDYDVRQQPTTVSPLVKGSRVQPLAAIEFTHASQRRTLFGARIRYFDNKVDVGAWLGVMKLGAHDVRVEVKYISSPVGRARFAWETAGGTLVQLRYRLGY
jgi:hypothetical protein